MCTYISAKLGLVSSTKVKTSCDLDVHEIYFPQQLGFLMYLHQQPSAQKSFLKILIDPGPPHKHYFSQNLLMVPWKTEENYAHPLHYLICDEGWRDFIADKSASPPPRNKCHFSTI